MSFFDKIKEIVTESDDDEYDEPFCELGKSIFDYYGYFDQHCKEFKLK